MAQGVGVGVGGVAERDVVKVDGAVGHLGDGVGGIVDGRDLVQHLQNPVAAGQGPGQQQKDVGYQHQGVHHLHDVAEKARQLAHFQGTGQNHSAAEPQQQHRGPVHGHLKGRGVEDGGFEGVAAGFHEPAVDRLEAFLGVVLPDKGLDGPHGRQMLLDHIVHPVHSRLQHPVGGGHLPDDGPENDGQHRHAQEEDHCQGRAHINGQSQTHQQHDGAAEYGAKARIEGVLQHRHVGGHAGDERRCLEVVQIGKGQLLDRLILGPAQIRAEAVGGPGRVPGL